MSRSYKKTAGWKDHNKSSKKFASRKARRRINDLQDGSMYKKIYNQYNICDYKWLYFSKKAIEISNIISNEYIRYQRAVNQPPTPLYKYYMK